MAKNDFGAGVIVAYAQTVANIRKLKRSSMTQEAYFREFQNALNLMAETTGMKNQDYASCENAFKNFNQIEIITDGNVPTELGILTRMTDKLTRLGSILSRKDGPIVAEERAHDNALDLAVYSVILFIYLKEKRRQTEKDYEEQKRDAYRGANAEEPSAGPTSPFARPGQGMVGKKLRTK